MKLFILVSAFLLIASAGRLEWYNYPKDGNDVVWIKGGEISPVFCWKGGKEARTDKQNWHLVIDGAFKRSRKVENVKIYTVPEYIQFGQDNNGGEIPDDMFSKDMDLDAIQKLDKSGNPLCWVAVGKLPDVKGKYYLKLKRKWGWKWVPGHRSYNGSPYFRIMDVPANGAAPSTNMWNKTQAKCNEAYNKCKSFFRSTGEACKKVWNKCVTAAKGGCNSIKNSCSKFGSNCKDFWNRCFKKNKVGDSSDASEVVLSQHETEEEILAAEIKKIDDLKAQVSKNEAESETLETPQQPPVAAEGTIENDSKDKPEEKTESWMNKKYYMIEPPGFSNGRPNPGNDNKPPVVSDSEEQPNSFFDRKYYMIEPPGFSNNHPSDIHS